MSHSELSNCMESKMVNIHLYIYITEQLQLSLWLKMYFLKNSDEANRLWICAY